MKRKIYNLLSSVKQGLFALALTVFSGTAYSQASYTFNYTGTQQTVALTPGSYTIRCWGANGGDGTYYSAMNPNNNISGGKGGYSTGTYSSSASSTLYIYVGGKGSNTLTSNNPGGYNGGGNSSNQPYAAGSGGGASHVATVTGVLSTLSGNQAAVKIVAGGGGGGGNQSLGGDGGGLNGIQSPNNTQFSNRTAGGGGSQVAAGTCFALGINAGFGQGGTTSHNLAGGGGGGWYGGCTGDNSTAGGGGSGYIGGVTNGTTIVSGQPGFVLNPDPTGNGRVVIVELCNVTIMSSSTGTANPSILCSGNSLTLTTNAVSGYSWSTGQTTSSIVVAPTTNTVYQLTATSSLACTSTGIMNVIVSPGLPVLSVSSSTNMTCLGKTVTLTASGAVNYTWTNGVINGASHSPSVTNTYTVVGENGCGTTSAVTTITVAPLPVSVIASPTVICATSAATLTAVSGATGYTWQPFNITGSVVPVSPSVTTIYTVSVSDGTCAGTATLLLLAKPIPTIGVVASTSVACQGGPVTMTASGGINYTWTPGNLNGPSVTVNPSGPTLYVVTGDNSVSCTSSAAQIVLTNPSPTMGIVASSTFICSGDAVNLLATGSASSYTWINGPQTAANAVNPTSSTIYTVIGANSSTGCTTTKTVEVTVFIFPVSISSTPPSPVCSGTSLTLTASGADGFTWVDGPPQAENVVTPTVTITYSVTGNTSSLAITCNYSGTVQITVNPNPTVTATSNRTVICKGESTILNASGAPNFTWSTGANASAATVSPNFVSIFTYSVTGIDANNCKNLATIQVKVNSCTGLEQFTAGGSQLSVYPNPNNGEFIIQSDGEITLELVNALGQKVNMIRLTENSGYTTIISGLPNGIYFISGQKNNQLVQGKIVVNK